MTSPEQPCRPTIPLIVRRAASLFGDGDYVVLPDRRLSFRQLEGASRRLAKHLLAAGVGKGSRVGIHLPSGPEWVVAFAAVTRVGAMAMPFSTIYRPVELRAAMRIGDVSLLLSAPTILGKDHEDFLEETLPGLDSADAGRLRIPVAPYLRAVWLLGGSSRVWAGRFDVSADGAGEVVDGIDDALLGTVEDEVAPADPAVVVFTSGTAADPKAVVHSQGAVVRKTSPRANAALNAIFPGRVLSLMPFFWIGGVQEVLSALHSGAAILTLERLNAAAALELGERERASSILGSPQAMRSLFGDADVASVIPTIRELPMRPWQGGPSSRGHMATGIGMTETFGPWSNVTGMECRIVNPETGAQVADGQIGEFHVRGYGLMQGLYKREREEVFTPDGFYATGDLGYMEHDRYFFSARIKDMIKTRGANVAPAEVEVVLNGQPGVRISFVAGVPHEKYGEEVVAGVVPENGHTIDFVELLTACRRALSSYKVPTMIELLGQNEIPYLSSGKPNRRAITQMLDQRRGERRGHA
ncbi:class I adenylate-forming enzyme family protein [Pseudofrankia sp. BMG5.37]|uniref:class I adenylate-forming enzyme family protein n=1 Tax=Pseudofrankia sp. BMG5.37 TaxID=3050035 RepID=UPI0028942959|nr:class I adenylate-forming enzyme family protein [Pseudofrankia sp. BMG5.37]MDT3442210.1 class I adenylate-forming enzyme family protein [Pseudofrankia sp. BMG5.37]